MRLNRIVLISLFILLLAVISIFVAQAKVGRIKLAKLIKTADYIVLAHVESVDTNEGIRIARAVAEKEFKASNNGQAFYFVAEPTWECDISAAVPGETVLLFLTRVRGQTVERSRLGMHAVHVKAQPLFTIAHWGRGRMPLHYKHGETYVTPAGIILPHQIKEARRSVLLADIVRELPKP